MSIQKLLLGVTLLAGNLSFAAPMAYSLGKNADPNAVEGGTTPDCPFKKGSALNAKSQDRIAAAKNEKKYTHYTSDGRVAR